jgi:hypothetical protein
MLKRAASEVEISPLSNYLNAGANEFCAGRITVDARE